jgi:hypothetical protein
MRIERIPVSIHFDGYTDFQHFSQFHVAPRIARMVSDVQLGVRNSVRVSYLLDTIVKRKYAFSRIMVPSKEKPSVFPF